MRKLATIVAVELLLVVILVTLFFVFCDGVFAEGGTEYYVLCRPGVYVNVRQNPARRSEVIGELELGDAVQSDGKEKNGFIHLTGLHFELTEGWIYKGLLVEEPPVVWEIVCQTITDGRVAARHYINGKRKSWIKAGGEITVYAFSKSWSITEKGYVQTRFLSVNYPEIWQQENGD